MSASMGSKSLLNQSSQTCVVIDNIAGGDSFILESYRQIEKDAICVVSSESENAYLYRQTEGKTILQLPNTCISCNSYTNAEGSYFLFGLSDGAIVAYKVCEATGQDKKKKKKKKKKSKHKEKELEKALPKESAEPLSSSKAPEEVDIFADLLGTNANQQATSATTVSNNQALPSGEGPLLVTSSVRTQLTYISQENVILRENNLQDFLIVNDCLVTCAHLETGWTVSVYRMKTVLDSVEEAGDKMVGPACETTLVYRTYFPSSVPVQRISSFGCPSNVNPDSLEQSTNRKPCLKCVVSSSTQLRSECGSTPSKLLDLQDELFNDLFGADSNLLDSPVVLFGLPDGRIYQVALKSLRNQSAEVEQQPLEVKDRSDVVFGLNGNMLYHMQEGVVDIIQLDCKDGCDKKSGSQCLVLLGKQGKLVTVVHSPHETSQVQFDEHFITGPLTASCSTATHVIYSTLRALFAVAVRCDGQTRSGTGGMQRCAIEMSSLGVGRVCALEVLKSSTFENGAIHYQLLATLTNGKVVLINFPLATNTSGNQAQPITAAAAGQRMKELLHAINNVSIRMHQLSISSIHQDKVLAELSKACHLAGQLLGSSLGSRNFDTQVQCIFQDDGTESHVSLQCKVTNRSGFVLSHGWSLVLCMIENVDWPLDEISWDSAHQITRTVQLKDFEHGKSVTVFIPLDQPQVPLKVPLQVRWHLYFNVSDLADHIAGESIRSYVQTSKMELGECGAVLSFAINTVNIFLLLRPFQDTRNTLQQDGEHSPQTGYNSGYDWLNESLEAVASVSILTNRKRCEKDDLANEGPVSSTLMFKHDIMKTIKADMAGIKAGTGNQEVLVLKWLFRNNPSVLSAVTGNQLETVTPDGKKISFVCVHKDPGSTVTGQGSSKEEGSYVELTMVAPDYECMCQLQETVHKDMKDVLQRCAHTNVIIPRTQLQKQHRRLQGLLQRLETLEDQLVSSQGFHGNRTDVMKVGHDTLEMYRQMRTSHWTL